jgi:hypothetical protein
LTYFSEKKQWPRLSEHDLQEIVLVFAAKCQISGYIRRTSYLRISTNQYTMRFRQIDRYFIPLFLTMACMTSSITSGQSTYQSPPVEIVDVIDIKPEPAISFSPDANWMLLVDRDSMPDIADVARRMVALAGNRIDPVANGPFRTDFNRGISLRPRDGRNAIRIPLQDPSRVGTVSWSHAWFNKYVKGATNVSSR